MEEKHLLENLASGAKERFENRLTECRQIFIETEKANADYRAYERALEAFTRDSDSPYKPSADTWQVFITSLLAKYAVGENQNISAPPKQYAPVINLNPTKVSVVRKIFQTDVNKNWTIKEIAAATPPDTPFTMSGEDVWKSIPRMVKRGEVVQVGRGMFRWATGQNTNSNGHRLFTEAESM